MLMPRIAVMITVMATKMADLISGPAMPARLMSGSPDNHHGSAEKRRDEQATPGRQRGRRPPEGESSKLPDQLGLGGGAGQAAGGGRAGGARRGYNRGGGGSRASPPQRRAWGGPRGPLPWGE